MSQTLQLPEKLLISKLQSELNGLKKLEDTLFLQASLNNFAFHFKEIFSAGIKAVEGKFIYESIFEEWCDFIQANDWTDSVGPRRHGKTTCQCLGYLAWRLWQIQAMEKPNYEIMLMSVKGELAAQQIRNLNRYIEYNPFYKEFEPTFKSDSYAEYKYRDKTLMVYPEGIGSATRSLHPDEVYITDPHTDPDRKDATLDPVEIVKTTQIFKRSIVHIPKDGGKLHVESTRISKHDIHGYCQSSALFKCRTWKAIINDAQKIILCPNMWTWDRLNALRNDSPADFEQEFQAVPLRSVMGYVNAEDLDAVIVPDSVNIDFEQNHEFTRTEVRGGYDLGKKAHPSHVSVFKYSGNGKKEQIVSFWMDRMDYTDQLPIVEKMIDNLHIDSLPYDDTRGELTMLHEQGRLPPAMEPVIFNAKIKQSMARCLGSAIRKREILLLDDVRQTSQILNCDGDLKSESTSDGHGDSFWSNALALQSFEQPQPMVWALR